MVIMEYRRFAPDPRLSETVEHYWLIVAPAPVEEIRAVLIPNGRATVQFCLGEPGHRLRPGTTSVELNADVLLPVTTDPYVLVQSGPSHYVGVQFTPWGAATAWHDAPREPTPIGDVATGHPTDAALKDDLCAALDRWLLAELSPGPVRGRRDTVVSAVRMVDQDTEGHTVASLGATLGVSTATLYRAFRRWIGISPKEYLSVRRYERFMARLIEQSRGNSPAMLAAAAGYADQAHAAREFRRHTGMNATAFRDRLDGIAEMMFRDMPPR
ncbi:AraC family transcriptional regulator [Pseudoclavibacter endophyticus]|uniref:Helix-turn-helix domain-containing protein n=1 Tax=Pseudoclavibacter endophyticus TaxID=1778590 RepID=A0A6H9WMC4_9MICO|nr:helix-turn-helix domain-containing protein [Pseudoclavibacter endophyticus]KAB1650036.1 helix-turn-helix domain-containing protein [Pseudoclavibacter endophyticus]GGA57769.1 AraC family transcriptional regulator [Pseudoclavibacter endophyticus]